MPIAYCKKNKTFHLYNEYTSYVMQVSEMNHLLHAYWGKRLFNKYVHFETLDYSNQTTAFKVLSNDTDPNYSLESIPQEYPSYGTGDNRSPAFHIEDSHGYCGSEIFYKKHRILAGKKEIKGLPSTYCEQEEEAQTVVITMEDPVLGLEVDLIYSIYEKYNAITRHVVFRNIGSQALILHKAMSCSVDYNDCDMQMISLKGSWARERDLQVSPLTHGIQSIESRRGASGSQLNPFYALTTDGDDEDHGSVYGFNLVYSGNFLGQVEVCMDDTARAMLGMGSFDFSWKLNPNDDFSTPEGVMVYSSEGLGAMSRSYHKLYRERLCRGEWRDRSRPVLFNNWEATYFDFDYERIINLAIEAQRSGADLFVLDDGWFGKRDSDKTGLGDWTENQQKLSGGLKKLGDSINKLGLKFGLWFEPEMVSPDSDLYRAHPDWCLHIPNRERKLGRYQLMLDFSRNDVCDHILEQLTHVISSAPIEYIKWDFNRNSSEVGSALLDKTRQKETLHRYYLGLYRVLDTLVKKFPQILFESCSGGGGRFDPGMLAYMPQTWASDNTDPVSRLRIQYGTSIVYPLSSTGAHVSASPNHITGRITDWATRTHVAFFGTFGYELDLAKESDEDKAAIPAQIERFKLLAPTIHQGDFYRIQSPFDYSKRAKGNEVSWICVNQDKTQAVALWVRILAIPNKGVQRLKLKGLNPQARYRIQGDDQTYGGDELMYMGLAMPTDLKGDFKSQLFVIDICT